VRLASNVQCGVRRFRCSMSLLGCTEPAGILKHLYNKALWSAEVCFQAIRREAHMLSSDPMSFAARVDRDIKALLRSKSIT
jgi:hypothetical protein